MASVPWDGKEIDSFVATLKESIKLSEAVVKHNKKWNTNRTVGGSERAMARKGLPSPGSFLLKGNNLNKKNVKKDFSTALLEENKELRSKIKQLEADKLEVTDIIEIIHDLKNVKYDTSPDWIKDITTKDREVTGIPVLVISDFHFDEIVKPEQIQYCNEYNREIAEKRFKFIFQTVVKLCFDYMSKPNYEGIVVPLGGDLLSGIIHEELAETNEFPILKSVIDLTELLIQAFELLLTHFSRVFVPCVVGNHTRLHKKPRAKNKVIDNYEWLVYQNVAKYFRNNPNIQFKISLSSDVTFQIYNKKFILSHGDQFRGGTGISGAFAPLMLGQHRKQKRQNSIGSPFDIMIIGHWHQYIHLNSLVVNGSVKGYDEYAHGCNFDYEPPTQALFIMHPELGATFRMPIFCEKGQKYEKSLYNIFVEETKRIEGIKNGKMFD